MAARSSAKPLRRTSLAEWRNVEHKRRPPAADFRSEEFMIALMLSGTM